MKTTNSPVEPVKPVIGTECGTGTQREMERKRDGEYKEMQRESCNERDGERVGDRVMESETDGEREMERESWRESVCHGARETDR